MNLNQAELQKNAIEYAINLMNNNPHMSERDRITLAYLEGQSAGITFARNLAKQEATVG